MTKIARLRNETGKVPESGTSVAFIEDDKPIQPGREPGKFLAGDEVSAHCAALREMVDAHLVATRPTLPAKRLIGIGLFTAKRSLPHGEFIPFLRVMGLSKGTAYRLMTLAWIPADEIDSFKTEDHAVKYASRFCVQKARRRKRPKRSGGKWEKLHDIHNSSQEAFEAFREEHEDESKDDLLARLYQYSVAHNRAINSNDALTATVDTLRGSNNELRDEVEKLQPLVSAGVREREETWTKRVSALTRERDGLRVRLEDATRQADRWKARAERAERHLNERDVELDKARKALQFTLKETTRGQALTGSQDDAQ